MKRLHVGVLQSKIRSPTKIVSHLFLTSPLFVNGHQNRTSLLDDNLQLRDKFFLCSRHGVLLRNICICMSFVTIILVLHWQNNAFQNTAYAYMIRPVLVKVNVHQKLCCFILGPFLPLVNHPRGHIERHAPLLHGAHPADLCLGGITQEFLARMGEETW